MTDVFEPEPNYSGAPEYVVTYYGPYGEKRRKSEERKLTRRLWEQSLQKYGTAHLQSGVELAPGTEVMYRDDGVWTTILLWLVTDDVGHSQAILQIERSRARHSPVSEAQLRICRRATGRRHTF